MHRFWFWVYTRIHIHCIRCIYYHRRRIDSIAYANIHKSLAICSRPGVIRDRKYQRLSLLGYKDLRYKDFERGEIGSSQDVTLEHFCICKFSFCFLVDSLSFSRVWHFISESKYQKHLFQNWLLSILLE